MAKLFGKKYSARSGLYLDEFLDNGSIRIPQSYWQEINSQYDINEIKDAMINVVRKYDMPVPGAFTGGTGGIENALIDFKKLQRLDTRNIVQRAKGRIVTRHKYTYGISDYFLQVSAVGKDASDYFQRAQRVACGTVKFASPADAWADNDKLHSCLSVLWSLKAKGVNSAYLFAALALRQYAASQFRVSAAKAIYELFAARRVLDTSSGWGDRFAGFSAAACTEQYLGIDPNSKLHPGYANAHKLYATGKRANFLEAPAEDVILPRNYFDLMFTSPPYFETERYSEEDTQSWKRYNQFDSWKKDFLFVVICNAWRSLKPGGYLVVNIADLGVTYGDVRICDDMNNYIATLKGAYYVGCIGLRLGTRPNTGIKKGYEGEGPPVFIEPIWIWRKGADSSVTELVQQFYKGNGISSTIVSKNNRVKLTGV